MAAERDYPLVALQPGPIFKGMRDELLAMIRAFEPLRFEAAEKAKAWLETNVSAGLIPLRTYLVFQRTGAGSLASSSWTMSRFA